MTRVLMVSSLWPPSVVGGAELYASRLAVELRAAGHEVAVLTFGVAGPDVVGSVPPWPYRLETWSTQPQWKRALLHGSDLYRPATARAVRSAIDRFEPDVVHSHAVQGLSTAALLEPARLGLPHVHSLHDYWLLCQRTTLRTRTGRRCGRCSMCGALSALRRGALRISGPHVFVAPSSALARRHAHDGYLRRHMRVIRHPAEPSRRRTRRRPPGNLTFGYLGQLTASKGVPTLLRGFERFATGERAGSRLLVAGTGPLADLVARRRVPGVEALGWVNDVAREEFFAAIDCLVVPSEWDEPAGLVVTEAAARGVPVIASDAGGIPEYVAPASRPLLFPAGDDERLAAAMAVLADRPESAPADDTDHLPTWPQHLTAVTAAYADAAAARGRRGAPS